MGNKICTSLEQSKKLIELGVDRKTSDMYYWCGASLRIGGYRAQEEDLDIPAWSLSALLELMPNKIVVNDENYFLNFTKKTVEYRGIVTWDGQKCISREAENLLDAAFEMVCWILKIRNYD